MKKGLCFIILAGILWGTSCIFVHILSPYGFDSGQMTTIRMTVSLIGMFLYCLLFYRKAFKIKKESLLLALICGSMISFTASFYYESMILTSASTSVVLMYTSPVPIMFFSVLFFGEKFNSKKGIATILMLIGCALVSGIIGGFQPNPRGILMGLLSSATYTIYNLFNKLSAKRSVDPISVSLYSYLFAMITSLFFSKPSEIVAQIQVAPLPLIPLLLLLGITTCLLPYLLYTISLKYISVGIASSLSMIEPLTASLFGWILFREEATAPALFGIAMVLLAVFLLGISEPNKKTSP